MDGVSATAVHLAEGQSHIQKTGDWGGVPRSWTVCDDNDDGGGGGGGDDDDAILTSSRNLAVKSA